MTEDAGNGWIQITSERLPFVKDDAGKDFVFQCGTTQTYRWYVGGSQGFWDLPLDSDCNLEGEGTNKVNDLDIVPDKNNDIQKYPISERCLNGEG